MRYLAVLGRQREISLAELEALFGEVQSLGAELATFRVGVGPAANELSSKLYNEHTSSSVGLVGGLSNDAEPDISRLGGSLKLARELREAPLFYLAALPEGKITLALSDYTPGATARKVGAEALGLKKALARQGRSVRVLMGDSAVIPTATAHHNQLAEKKNHVELIKYKKTWWVLTGVQNISAYARRDQARPARDAKVGMLPPKLAQILINLCGPLPTGARVLDPFCGTGVLLQEALLMGYQAYGTDLEGRMIRYADTNLSWLVKGLSGARNGLSGQNALKKGDFLAQKFELSVGDARDFVWRQPIDAVACETYLGRPMSQPPAEIKLKEEKQTCTAIILGFLRNLVGQIVVGTPVVIAVPAWLRPDGHYARLGIIDEIEELGYNVIKYKFAGDGLLYHREGQVVAREIIALRKK